MIRCRYTTFFTVIICLLTLGHASANSPQRPDILFILADDLAWADLGCYGHQWHHTPHLDALAQSGIQFTQGYASAPICSASRASILTGKTVARTNFEFVTKQKPGGQIVDAQRPLQTPPFTLNLPLEETTIAEHLTKAGYETCFYGKWHVSQHHRRYLGWSPTHGPLNQGFQIAEEDFGSHPYDWKRNPPQTITQVGQYPADSHVEKVCHQLEQPCDRPRFVMASSFFVHTPVRSPCEWLINKYEKLVPRESPNRKQRIEYAAFVETLDHHVGRMLTALKNSGKAENTLVVFLSDNGGHPEYTANAPFRGSKWNLYEGGIRVPFLLRWPKQLEAGTKSDSPVVGYDLLATFCEAAGITPKVKHDGLSILQTMKAPQTSRALLWHFPYYHPETDFKSKQANIGINDFAVSQTRPASALRLGQHKLIYFPEDNRTELYDLKDDPSEQKDLSKSQPQLQRKMSQQLFQLLKEQNARMATPPKH